MMAEVQEALISFHRVSNRPLSIDKSCPCLVGLSLFKGNPHAQFRNEGRDKTLTSEENVCELLILIRTKGYYQSTLRSVYGNVGMRIRRLRGCSCVGARQNSFSAMFTNKDPTTPELKSLTAKLAALLPFGKVADFLGELLPLSAQTTPNTVRNRTMKVGRRLQRSAEALVVSCWERFVV